MGIEQQINQILQLIIPSIGYALYNFTFLCLLIGQLYSLNMKEVKIDIAILHILCCMYQIIAILFLFTPTAIEADMTLTYLFLGLVGGSITADESTNPLKCTLVQFKDALFAMKRDLIVFPIDALKKKLIELEKNFYPKPEVETEDII